MKKILTTILLLVVTLTTFSQTSLDYLLFDKCNEYRKKNGLQEWEWSTRAFKPAEHHSNYQLNYATMGHDENTITPRPTSRLIYYGIEWTYSGENVGVICSSNMSENANS